MKSKQKKPQLTKTQIENIQWLNTPKKNAIKVGRYKEYWILSQNKKDSPYLVYDQAEWDAFVDGVNKHKFDEIIK